MWDKIVRPLYHLSALPLAESEEVVLWPRIPGNRSFIANEDKRIRRICVSTSIDNCIRALCVPERQDFRYYFVYRLVKTLGKIFEPSEIKDLVFDAEACKEYWLTKKSWFVLDRIIHLDQSKVKRKRSVIYGDKIYRVQTFHYCKIPVSMDVVQKVYDIVGKHKKVGGK